MGLFGELMQIWLYYHLFEMCRIVDSCYSWYVWTFLNSVGQAYMPVIYRQFSIY